MHVYEVLKRPVITEKTTDMQDEANQFVFKVDRRANKMLVKQAVEERFDVEVVKVNIVNMKAKTRRRGCEPVPFGSCLGRRRLSHWRPEILSNFLKASRSEVRDGIKGWSLEVNRPTDRNQLD